MGPNQTYKLLHSKGNHKKKERRSIEWEKLVLHDAIDEGLISKIYKQLIQLNSRKKKKQNKKNPTTQLKNGQKI